MHAHKYTFISTSYPKNHILSYAKIFAAVLLKAVCLSCFQNTIKSDDTVRLRV